MLKLIVLLGLPKFDNSSLLYFLPNMHIQNVPKKDFVEIFAQLSDI